MNVISLKDYRELRKIVLADLAELGYAELTMEDGIYFGYDPYQDSYLKLGRTMHECLTSTNELFLLNIDIETFY